MRFLNYIRTLLPTFSSNSVLESCELTKTSISEHTLPAYKSACELWKGNKFKSADILDITTYYSRTVGDRNLLESVTEALENSQTILNLLLDRSKKIMNTDEASMGLSYTKTTLIQLIQASEYANTYARRLLNYIYICETKVENAEDQSKLSQAEIDWLTDGLIDFCICIKFLKVDTKVIEKHLDGLPDATVTDITEKTFITTIGDGKLDPFQLRHLSARVNPFFLFGMIQANFQAKRYKAAKEELELLRLRTLNLKKQFEKHPDAKLEKEIAYFQNRVSGLNFDLDKMEKSYGLD